MRLSCQYFGPGQTDSTDCNRPFANDVAQAYTVSVSNSTFRTKVPVGTNSWVKVLSVNGMEAAVTPKSAQLAFLLEL